MARVREDERYEQDHLARDFAVNAMFCPGCRTKVEDAVEFCPQCGFSGQESVRKFLFEAPEMQRYLDPEGLLSAADRSEIDKSLTDLAKRFPQPHFCFCLLGLEEGTDPREFGFWLMNASPARDFQAKQERPWTILILVDEAYGRVSVTPGYAIEPFLSEVRWTSLLRNERSFFATRSFGQGLVRVVEGAVGVLSEAAEQTDRRLSQLGAERRKGARWR